MADHGAEVIKVESAKRPDSRPDPSTPPELTVQSSCYFAENNRNKYGIAVDLTTEQGRQIILELAAKSDVVTENNAPGVMSRLGLGHEELQRVNPSIITISMPGFGAGTRHSGFAAYGGTLMCYTGMSYLWGLPGSRPADRCQLAYPDYITAAHVPLVALAALHYRARTGEGQHIEIPQIESTAAFIGPAYLEHLVNGAYVEPEGNDSRRAAPHRIYQCLGSDRWVAISVSSDDEWRALTAAVQQPSWADDPRFKSAEERLSHRAELNALVGEWTSQRTPLQCARILQHHGVPAAPVQTGEDLYLDPHLRERGYVLALDHPGIGRFEHSGLTVRFLDGSPPRAHRPAPLLGADTIEVMTTLLNRSPAEAHRLVEAGVLA